MYKLGFTSDKDFMHKRYTLETSMSSSRFSGAHSQLSNQVQSLRNIEHYHT